MSKTCALTSIEKIPPIHQIKASHFQKHSIRRIFINPRKKIINCT